MHGPMNVKRVGCKANAKFPRMFAGNSRCESEEQRRGISPRVLILSSK